MPSQPLFPIEDSDRSEPDLIPVRDRPQTDFSKPFEIRVVWLVLLGAVLLVWQISLSDWRSLLDQSGQLLWLGAIVPVGVLWWRLRRLSSKRRRASREPAQSQIRIVSDDEQTEVEEVASWKLIGGMIAYVVAVLTLIAIALRRMLS